MFEKTHILNLDNEYGLFVNSVETLPWPGNLADVKSDVLGGTLVGGVEKEGRQALCGGVRWPLCRSCVWR